MTIKLNLTAPSWSVTHKSDNQTFYFSGSAYLDGQSITISRLASYLGMPSNFEILTPKLNSLNGFYAFVEHSRERIFAAVDHIRSRPLFYANYEGCLYLSDDAEWVRQQVGDSEMDPLAREEFQIAGFVTGADTLFPKVNQLQAGEFLEATEQDEGWQVRTHRFYRFLHTEPDEVDEPNLRARLEKVAIASIQRLIDYANGRQIVVPLSGGYDSRLIVMLLKRLGYDNILTFTYGVPGNKESAYSKIVAHTLGLRWYFVEYSDALWRKAWHTPERWDYQKWASGWNSTAHMQDWLAVKILKNKGVMELDCVFVPGHTGDFISGGHIPEIAFESSCFTLEDATNALFLKHYALAPLKLFQTRRETWSKRIRDRMERDEIETSLQFADSCEKWEWQERQAKYICNSVRVYEFFGYDWWMPLWDKEFVELWEVVPLQLRREQDWYKSFVKEIFENGSLKSKVETLVNASDSWLINKANTLRHIAPISGIISRTSRIRSYIKKSLFIMPFAGRFLFNKMTKSDPLCWYSRYRHIDTFDLYKRGFTRMGINAFDNLTSFYAFLEKEK